MNCIISLKNWIELCNYIFNKNAYYYNSNNIDIHYEQEIKNRDLEFFINNIKSI